VLARIQAVSLAGGTPQLLPEQFSFTPPRHAGGRSHRAWIGRFMPHRRARDDPDVT